MDTATETLPAQASPQTPMALIQMAVQSNADPDKLEKLMDLQERWQSEQARKSFFDAMNKVQIKAPVVVRDAVNNQTNSRYAKLETVAKHLKPVYTAEGLSLSFGTDASPNEGCVRVTCDVQHVDGHERRYFADIPLDLAGIKGSTNKTRVHATGSSYSYGQRYLTCLIFNVTVADQDDDGNGPDSAATVTEEQAIKLREFAESIGEDVPERFLSFLRYKSFDEIPASRFNECLDLLRKKEREAKG